MRTQSFLRFAAGALSLLLVVHSQTVTAGDWLKGQYSGNLSGCSECGETGYPRIGGPRLFGGYGHHAHGGSCATGDCGAGGCSSGATMGCGGFWHGCGLLSMLHHGHGCGHGMEGTEPGFNCGCNGSYNYPVPPLYIYHWPGMYKQQLMTNYQSPWRFPPLQPYTDEAPPRGDEPPALPTTRRASPLIPATALLPLKSVETPQTDGRRPGSVEPLSEKLQRAFR